MTPPSTSESRPKADLKASNAKAVDLDEKSTRAKRDFIAAAYAASPLRMVEKHPMASVTATAATTMAITVIATSRLFTSAGVGVLGKGIGLASMLARSNFANLAMQSVLAKATGVVPPPGQPVNPPAPPPPVAAAG